MRIINYFKKIRLYNTYWYVRDFKRFISLNSNNSDFAILKNYPCIQDRDQHSGVYSGGAYFYQDIYMAQRIFKSAPIKHVDIGSRIDGFISHLSVFREVEVFDIRPQSLKMQNVIFKQLDFMKNVIDIENYCDSISCLHTLEHFGLGRYGDEIDPEGHKKGFYAISKLLKSSGIFYFSVPLGPNRIEFNAHRVFSLRYLLSWVTIDFDIVEFSYIDDTNNLFENVSISNSMVENNCNCFHGCALFILKKK